MASQHSYTLDLKWTGTTEDPRTYDRSFTLSAQGKAEIAASADTFSRGDGSRWNPEEMLLASISSCHMLWYLYLCATAKIVVTSYEDHPTGILNLDPAGTSKFVEATLNPKVVITDSSRIEEARKLEQQAHDKCFIINSLNFEVSINAQVVST